MTDELHTNEEAGALRERFLRQNWRADVVDAFIERFQKCRSSGTELPAEDQMSLICLADAESAVDRVERERQLKEQAKEAGRPLEPYDGWGVYEKIPFAPEHPSDN